MTDKDNITLPREVAKLALDHIEWYIENERGGRFAEVREAAEALRTALAAPEPVRHPGYIIGNHWLETAYSRVCMGEAEADVLRDCGWQRVADIDALLRSVEALRRDAERWRHWRDNYGFAKVDHDAGRCFVTLACDAPDPDQAIAKRFAEQDFDEWLGAFTDAAMEASTAPSSAAMDAPKAPEAKP